MYTLSMVATIKYYALDELTYSLHQNPGFKNVANIDNFLMASFSYPFFCKIQCDVISLCGDVVQDSFSMAYSDKDSIKIEQKYEKRFFYIFVYEDFSIQGD